MQVHFLEHQRVPLVQKAKVSSQSVTLTWSQRDCGSLRGAMYVSRFTHPSEVRTEQEKDAGTKDHASPLQRMGNLGVFFTGDFLAARRG